MIPIPTRNCPPHRNDRVHRAFKSIAYLLALAIQACALSHTAGGPDVVTIDHIAVSDGRLDAPPINDTVVPPDSAGCAAGQMRCGTTCVAIDTTTNCGRCGNDCTRLFGVVAGSVTCMAGACSLACQPRYADCNGQPDDGCETDISMPAHCGNCATACTPAAPMCNSSGAGFACATGCTGATSTVCSGACVDVTTDPANCGSCAHACPAPANGRATCGAGACGIVCDANFHLCGSHCAADDSITECGAACAACTTSGGATARCSTGTCAIASCPAGFSDCNGNLADGCETDIRTPSNCGSCGNTCVLAHATAGCSAGACTIASCAGGYADCSGGATDGCETSTTTTSNCATCGTVCMAPANATATCTAGACGFNCLPGFMTNGGMCMPTTPANCGNRVLDTGEGCDDGNTTAGDGCSPACQMEATIAADNCPATTLIAHVGTQWYTGTTVGAANDFTCAGGVGNGPDRVYNLTTADGGNVVIELIPSAGYDTVFNSRTGLCPGIVQTFCRNSAGPGGTEMITGAVTTAGAQYTVIIDTVGAMPGSYQLRVTIN